MMQRHLKQLCEDLDIQGAGIKDERQFFQLPLNSTLSIEIKELDRGALLFSKISSCPKEKRETLFALLMKANFLGQGTLGATIGLDPEENFLTLSWAIPYDMDYREFKEAVEDFANIVDYWRDEMHKHQTTGPLFS